MYFLKFCFSLACRLKQSKWFDVYIQKKNKQASNPHPVKDSDHDFDYIADAVEQASKRASEPEASCQASGSFTCHVA